MTRRFAVLLLLLAPLLLLSWLTPQAAAQPALLVQKTWGGSNYDNSQGVAVDSSGNIYTTGVTASFGPGSPANSAVTLLKYSSAGNLLWQRIWSGTGNGTDVGQGVAVDSAGNLYVAGYTNSFGSGGYDVLLLKFNSTGSLLWQKTWGGSGNDVGQGVVVDASGNIYVTGYMSSFGAGGADVLLLKFDASGSLLWQKTWGGAGTDQGYGVAVDASGNVYVTGTTNSFGAGLYDVFLLKFNSSGSLQWQKTWGGTNTDYGIGVAVDSGGGVYVTGYTLSFGAGGADVFILKFDSTSGLLWQKTWGGSGYDSGDAVAVDSSGNVYVAGNTYSFGAGSADVLLLKFASSGSLLWQKTWGGSSYDSGFGVAVDSADNAILTGIVAEAPPYVLGSVGNLTLGMPSFSPGVPSFTLGTPSFTLHTPTGTVGTPLGSQSYAGSNDQLLLKYGEKPTITFQTNPSTVGSITFNTSTYSNGQTGNYTYGNATATAVAAAGYTFSHWTTTGGVTVASTTSNPTTATISGSGTLTASYTKTTSTPISPLDLLVTSMITASVLTLRRRRTT